jgi:hypothetical protein
VAANAFLTNVGATLANAASAAPLLIAVRRFYLLTAFKVFNWVSYNKF